MLLPYNPLPLPTVSFFEHLVVAAADILDLPHIVGFDHLPLRHALLNQVPPLLRMHRLDYLWFELAQGLQVLG